jgi:hypothetical protein
VEGYTMMAPQQIEELICLVSSLDRNGLQQQFQSYRGNFPVDFNPEFLANQPVERLRHIFLARCLQVQRMPEMACAAA